MYMILNMNSLLVHYLRTAVSTESLTSLRILLYFKPYYIKLIYF